jgi:anti-sigma B factor antagonist/stage II sporulation protein AA (anti-sigma F factor antagonist)
LPKVLRKLFQVSEGMEGRQMCLIGAFSSKLRLWVPIRYKKKSYICPKHHQYIMKITIQYGPETMISLSGQLDTLSAVEFEKEIRKAIDSSASMIVLDGKDLTYISSAGLRLLLTLRKGVAEKGGALKLQNIREEIMEIFNITGFSSILDIE